MYIWYISNDEYGIKDGFIRLFITDDIRRISTNFLMLENVFMNMTDDEINILADEVFNIYDK